MYSNKIIKKLRKRPNAKIEEIVSDIKLKTHNQIKTKNPILNAEGENSDNSD